MFHLSWVRLITIKVINGTTTLSCVDTSPSGPPSTLARDTWRSVCGGSEVSPSPTGRRAMDSLLFEVTDASIMRDGASKYVVSGSGNMWRSVRRRHFHIMSRDTVRVGLGSG